MKKIEAQRNREERKKTSKGERKNFIISNRVKNIQFAYNNPIKPKSAGGNKSMIVKNGDNVKTLTNVII